MEKPRACKTVEDITVGERFEKTYSISHADALAFANLSGDFNPVHFDDHYARSSVFGQKVAHGMLSVAKFSGIFGMDFPGLGTLWEKQEVRFVAPVYFDISYKAVALVTRKERRRVFFETWVEDQDGGRVLEGNGVVIPITPTSRGRLGDQLPLLLA